MTIPTLRRPGSAWAFVCEAIGALTAPRADVRQCDARVSALLRESRIAGWFSAAGRAGARAAETSAAMTVWRRLRQSVSQQPFSERVRGVACTVAVAMATALALRPLSSERDPLTWTLPLFVAVGAVIVAALAKPAARAIANYHR